MPFILYLLTFLPGTRLSVMAAVDAFVSSAGDISAFLSAADDGDAPGRSRNHPNTGSCYPLWGISNKTLALNRDLVGSRVGKKTGAAEATPVGRRKVMKIRADIRLRLLVSQDARRCP